MDYITNGKPDSLRIGNTGLRSGGGISVDVGDVTVTIAPLKGEYVDNFTNPDIPEFRVINIPVIPNFPPAGLGVSPVTFIGINKDSQVVQQLTRFTTEQRRDLVYVAFVEHLGGTIQDAGVASVSVSNIGLTLYDFQRSVGAVSSGLRFTANGANLRLNRSIGYYTVDGINFEANPKDPNKRQFLQENEVTFIRSYQDGASGTTEVFGQQDIDPTIWDDGTGTPATVTANKWTIKRVYMLINGAVVVTLGQDTYNSKIEAINSIISELVTVNPLLTDDVHRGYLITKGNATDLSDDAEAVFIQNGRFGNVGGEGASTQDVSATVFKGESAGITGDLLANTNYAFAVPMVNSLTDDHCVASINKAFYDDVKASAQDLNKIGSIISDTNGEVTIRVEAFLAENTNRTVRLISF